MILFRKKGLVDNIENKRIGILYLKIQYESGNQAGVVIISPFNSGTYNAIAEVKEIYCDKLLSKIKVVNIAFNNSNYTKRNILKSKHFPVWIESKKIYWLSPPDDINRDNKLKEILK